MTKRLLLALLVVAVAMAPMAAQAAGEKNNGVPGSAPAIKPAKTIPVGTLVQATVNYPSGSSCIMAGSTGTLICYDPTDSTYPYLVNWPSNAACTWNQCQYCGICAPQGWWVGFSEIAPVSTTWMKLTKSYPCALNSKDAELRSFRDGYMKSLPGGEALVGGFYASLPFISELVQSDPIAHGLGWVVVGPSSLIAQSMSK